MIAACQYVYSHTNGFMDLDGDQAQFEYEKAFGDLEDLLELYNMATMNSINQGEK